MRTQEPCHTGLAHRTLAVCTDPQDKCQVRPVILIIIPAVYSPFSVSVLLQRVAGRLRQRWAGGCLPSTVMVAAAHSVSSSFGIVYRLGWRLLPKV